MNASLSNPTLKVVDPRSPIKYLQGHIPAAVNVPVWKLFNEETLELLPDAKLLQIFGETGINQEMVVVTYDAYDGQNAAMLAWILEYLGHTDVRLLRIFFERWSREGWPVLYRPVKAEPRVFHGALKSHSRAKLQEVVSRKGEKLLDLRSEEEFHGKVRTGERAGHLPGAVSLPWTKLLGSDNQLLCSRDELEGLFAFLGLHPSDHIITYCAYGPRATIGYIALQQAGYSYVRVFDGSFNQWAKKAELPVE